MMPKNTHPDLLNRIQCASQFENHHLLNVYKERISKENLPHEVKSYLIQYATDIGKK